MLEIFYPSPPESRYVNLCHYYNFYDRRSTYCIRIANNLASEPLLCHSNAKKILFYFKGEDPSGFSKSVRITAYEC